MEELEFDRTRPADLRNAPRGNGTPPSNCHHSDAAKELATRAASHHGCRCCYCPCWCWCRWHNCQLPSVGHALRREGRAAPRHAAQARQLVSWCCMPVPWPWRAVSSIRWSPRDSGEQSQQQPVSSREGPPRTGSRRRARAPPARCAALSARCAGRARGRRFHPWPRSRSRGRPGHGRDLRLPLRPINRHRIRPPNIQPCWPSPLSRLATSPALRPSEPSARTCAWLW